MLLKKYFSLIFIVFIFFSNVGFSSEINNHLYKVPNRGNEFVSVRFENFKSKNKIVVSLINKSKNTIKKARDVIYISEDRKMTDAFFNEEHGNISFFLLTSNSVDKSTGIEGISYNTFIYDLDDDDIYFNQIPIIKLMNCIDGKDIERNIILKCEYKTKEKILNYLKTY